MNKFLIAAAAASMGTAAQAATITIDQQNTVGTTAGNVNTVYQSFSPTFTSLSYASAFVRASTSNPTFLEALFYQGLPSANLLLGTSSPVAVSNGPATDYEFFFSSPVSVTPGQTYSVQFRTLTIGNSFQNFSSNTNPYAGGGRGNSTTIDMRFAVGSAAPEPAAWAFMILGFGLVGSALRRRGEAVRRQRIGYKFA